MSSSLRLPYQTFGTKGDYVVCMAGFPDDQTSGFATLIQDFSKDHRVLAFCWPGFEKDGADKLPKWGYGSAEVRDAFHETLADFSEKNDDFNEFTLVIHDWGSVLGLLYQNKYPERVKKIVCFDVGIITKPPFPDFAIIAFYQLWFCWGYFITMLTSWFAGRWIGQAWNLIFAVFFAKTIGPAPHDKINRPMMEIDVRMCYPYWQFYFGPDGYFRAGPKNMLRPRFPTCPIFFMYGTKKNCMFHSQRFLKQIEDTPGCQSTSYDCGHWVQESKFKGEILTEMRSFMKEEK
jgi:cis-3-alkyl-4-acyloxetan-2-one decarboxylase